MRRRQKRKKVQIKPMISRTERSRTSGIRSDHSGVKFYLKLFAEGVLLYLIAVLPFLIYRKGLFFYYGDYNVQQIPFYILAHRSFRDGYFFWNSKIDLGSSTLGAFAFYVSGSPYFWLSMLFPEKWLPYVEPFLMSLKYGVTMMTSYAWLHYTLRMGTADLSKLLQPMDGSAACRMASGPDENTLTPGPSQMHRICLAAHIGAFLYTFSGFQSANIVFQHFHEVTSFFPLYLLCFDRLVHTLKQDGRLYFGVQAQAFIWMSAFMSVLNYYFFFGEVLFLVLYYIVRYWISCRAGVRESLHTMLRILICGVLGVLIASAYLIQVLDAVGGNTRIGETLLGYDIVAYSEPTTPLAILKSFFMMPDLVGRGSLFTSEQIRSSSLAFYIPVFAISAVLAAFMHRGKTWYKRMLAVCAVIAFVPILNASFSMFNKGYYARWYFMPLLLAVYTTMHILLEEDAQPENVIALRETPKLQQAETAVAEKTHTESAYAEETYAASSYAESVYEEAVPDADRTDPQSRRKRRRLRRQHRSLYYIGGRRELKKGMWICIAFVLIFCVCALLPSADDDGNVTVGNIMKYPYLFWIEAGFTFAGFVLLSCLLYCHRKLITRLSLRLIAAACLISTMGVLLCGNTIVSRSGGEKYRHQALESKPVMPDDDGSFYRVETDGTSTNYEMIWGYSTVHCFDSTVNPSIQKFYEGVSITRDVTSKIPYDRVGTRYLLSAKYFLDNNIVNGSGKSYTESGGILGYEKAGVTDGDYTVYENQHFIPMGFTFDSYITEMNYEGLSSDRVRDRVLLKDLILSQEDAEEIGYLLEEDTNLNQSAATDDELLELADERAATSCTEFSFDRGGFSAKTTLSKKNLVFFSVPYDRGFTACVDGQETKIYCVDYGLMAIVVPEGTHTIRFDYLPWGLEGGCILSIAAALLVAILWYSDRKRRSCVNNMHNL